MAEEFLRSLKISFKRFNFKLYVALLLKGLLPTIYTTVRIHYLGDLLSDWGVNIASQLSWVNLILEVVQEALILPLFYCIGETLTNRDQTVNKVKTGLLVTFGVYIVFTSIIAGLAHPLVEAMAQNPETTDATVVYIRLEMANSTLSSLVSFMIIVFVLLDMQRHIYAVLGIQMCVSMVLDTFFLSQLSVSLQLGVNGIAYTNMIAGSVTLVYTLTVFVIKFSVLWSDIRSNYNFQWFIEWCHVGKWSGLDSLFRNLFYMVFIVRMMNVVSEQGTYWVANGFIWSWLLLPYSPLAELLKQDTSREELMDHKEKTLAYFTIVAIITAIWLVSVPGWSLFFSNVLNAQEPEKIFLLVLIIHPFYILYMINTLADSVFYGKGKTVMLAIQSVVTNILVYGVAFGLFEGGVFSPSLISIALLFGTGIFVDCVITLFLYYRYLNSVNFQI